MPTLSGDFVQAMRLESGATVSINFDLAALLADALAEVRPLPGGERLPARIDGPGPAWMNGDPALMRRALAGLVAHAVRGADRVLAIRLASAADPARPGNADWSVEFTPTSAGMPSDFVEQVVGHHGGQLVLDADRQRLQLRLPIERG
ncbi:hypothetical protein [Derxia lacustris]|uniref:hypothetical protein n=1 Tax=Derxia lacustris TaxID=764842 RepID=UPI000A177EE9|nr:hypothetical protein [Derxia lacustris]